MNPGHGNDLKNLYITKNLHHEKQILSYHILNK